MRTRLIFHLCFVLACLILPFYNAYAQTDTSTQDAVVDSAENASDSSSTTTAAPKTEASTSSMGFIDGSGSFAAGAGVNLRINDPSSTNTGSASISIPIKVAPGRNGIAPNLVLTYNSGMTNGLAGVGWSLEMGAIQRSTKDLNYSANDYVVIANGSVSELAPRGDWCTTYCYGTKIEGAFSRYYYNTSTAGWELTSKNGRKYYYGSTLSSRQDIGGNQVFKWLLDKVEDTNGNYMTITYWKDQGEVYLERIDYTGNSAGLSPTNYVKFYYEARPDVPAMYISNSLVKTAYRLKTIEIVANGQRAGAFSLTYNMSGNTLRSLLKDVTQYGSDALIDGSGSVTGGTSLPNSSLSYTVDSELFNVGYSHSSICGPTDLNGIGDFNGDGKQDVWCRNGENRLFVSLSTGTSFAPVEQWGADSVCISGQPMSVGDFDGDGRTDILCINSEYRVFVHHSTGNSFQLENWLNSWVCSGTANLNGAGDFNGDGKQDIWCRNNENRLFVSLSTGTSFAPVQQWAADSVCTSGNPMSVGDFDGDGKTDILCINNEYKAFVHHSMGNSFHLENWLNSWPCSPTDLNGAGDFNGDGKQDIWCRNGENRLFVSLSTGTSFAPMQQWSQDSVCISGQPMSASDFDGDGKTDILCINSEYKAFVHHSMGNSFQLENWLNGWPCSGTLGLNGIGDFNGDGKQDIWCTNTAYNFYTGLSGEPNKINDFLSVLSNNIGGTYTISYLPSSAYTNTLLPFIVQTVASISVNDGNGNISTTNYTYSGGFFDSEDREFRGFSYVKATAPTGTTSETWFYQDDIFKGLPYEQITKDSAGNIYTRTYNTFQQVSPYTGVNFPYLAQKDDYIYDGVPTYKQAAVSFTYDSYGNITRKYLWGDVSITGDESDELMEYTIDYTKWLFLPSHTYVNDSIGALKAQAWSTYDTKGNLLIKTAWLNGGTNPAITYTYDSYGNRISITDPKTNPATTIAYDTASYTYPVAITNALGHSSTATYDYRFGQPLTKTDVNGNTTTYRYDVFGRIIEVTTPDDSAPTYAWKETYYDGLGRIIETDIEGPDNKVVITETRYNNKGVVEKTSLQYFDGLETPIWTYFTYDPVNRMTRVDNPDGTYGLKMYDKGRVLMVDANGHVKVAEKDVNGRLIKVEEYTGVYPSHTLYATTAYQYDALGNLLKVTDAAGNQTTMTYDTLSRKTSMNDPDMGYWTYQYDANGNLTSQTDAKSQTIGFTYDALNRITMKDYPSGADVYYAYDETFSTNSKGMLTTVTDASGAEKLYYDKLGRSVKSIKTVNGADYTSEMTYDALGRTTSIKYPDNDTVNYTYDAGGNLSQATGYVTYSNYNALGQPRTISYANGVSTIQQYDPSNNRLNSITTNSPSQGLQNISYTYDNMANITALTDALDANRTQNFTYDHLNRLTEAQSNSYGPLPLTWQYNEIGNMTYNSQLGNYAYGAKPHAVTQAGANTYSYDANGNMTGGAGRTITFDYENRAINISNGGSTVDSVYDYTGQRVKKITQSFTTTYISNLYECTNGTSTKYIFAGSQRIASKTLSDTYYYHADHLGSSSIVTDSTGNKVQEIYYYPFGGTRINTGSVNVKHKFTGQEEDAETELYYYGARYYDPKIARFITADTIVPGPFDPQALNRYSYCANNPVIYIDPSGHYFSLDPITGKATSKVTDDVLGIEQVDATVCYYGCVQGSINFTNNDVRQTRVGVGVGYGMTGSVRFASFDLSSGYGAAATVGYEKDNGTYASAYGGYGIVSASGTYYFKYDAYQVGVGVGYNGYSVSASYSNYGGWSAGAGYGGISANYSFETHKTRVSVNLDIWDLVETYNYEMSISEARAGPKSGITWFNPIINAVALTTVGVAPFKVHDAYYSPNSGVERAVADAIMAKYMAVGAVSNITKGNGLIKAGVGLAITPVYYLMVRTLGWTAYQRP